MVMVVALPFGQLAATVVISSMGMGMGMVMVMVMVILELCEQQH